MAGALGACEITQETGDGEEVAQTEEKLTLPDLSELSDGCVLGKSQTLTEYATECDTAMGGTTVPEFNCDDGSYVDEGHESGDQSQFAGGNILCDRPNELHRQCDPGSKFQVLHPTTPNPNVVMVAHCRKQGRGANYGDIAVIQYNKQNGATCFYQALGDLPPKSHAPTKGETLGGTFPWLTPAATANINCVGCHDNGPFIRSPYISHLAQDPVAILQGNVLPGSRDPTANELYNQSLPYRFVGADFQTWKVFSLQTTSTLCNQCHRMGMSSRLGSFNKDLGTAQDFGVRATSVLGQPPKKRPGTPFWMLLDQPGWIQAIEDEAQVFDNCGSGIVSSASTGDPLPAGCSWTEYGNGNTCQVANKGVINGGETPSTPGGPPIQDQVVPSTICNRAEGCAGFMYWTLLRGPLWTGSGTGVAIGAPGYRGSSISIDLDSNGFFAPHFHQDATGISPVPAGPGGNYEGIYFSDIKTVPNPTKCHASLYSATDDGTHAFTSTVVPGSASPFVAMVSGAFGNVAQWNPSSGTGDFILIADSFGQSTITQYHNVTPPGLTVGALKVQAWPAACDAWTPIYPVKSKKVTSDTQLVPYPQSKFVKCFISGLTGAWSKGGGGGVTQPVAKIYHGTSGDIRMSVTPSSVIGASDPNRVGAYASCIQLN